MKCPIFLLDLSFGPKTNAIVHPDCLQNECGWYDAIYKHCYLVTIGQELEHVHGCMIGIKDGAAVGRRI